MYVGSSGEVACGGGDSGDGGGGRGGDGDEEGCDRGGRGRTTLTRFTLFPRCIEVI